MNELTSLIEAGARAIEAPYFAVPIVSGNMHHRERVCCHQPHHQLRSSWPPTSATLHGELDKVGHPLLAAQGVGPVKPDLLVHEPGSMNGNDAAIEVKYCIACRDALSRDLQKLALFRLAGQCRRAIRLVFGEASELAVARIRAAAADLVELPRIEVWAHRAPDRQPTKLASSVRRIRSSVRVQR